MSKRHLERLSDLASEAHARIQQDFKDINPVVGISQGMRSAGIPADAMTIDCLKTGKRIIIILHDQHPEIIQYQFSFKAKDPEDEFETLQFVDLTAQIMYQWMKDYFSIVVN